VKLPSKSFAKGCLSGILLMVLIPILTGLVAWFGFKDPIEDYFIGLKVKHLKAPPVPMDEPVDYDWALETTEGEAFPMASLKGRPVFLYFWSAKCSSCTAAMDSVEILYEKTREFGLEFVCVSVEKDDDDAEERDIVIQERDFQFPVYVESEERPEMFSTRSKPAAYVLSPKGTLAFEHIGALNWDDERCLRFIEKLSLERPSS
jgi:peroxiredoxin